MDDGVARAEAALDGAPWPRGAVAVREVLRVDGRAAPADAATREALDALAVEEPLELRVDGEPVAITMRTPGQDADLALGFLFAEGLVRGPGDVGAIVRCARPGDEGAGNVLDVRSAAGHRIDPERILEGTRLVPGSSACGVCGRRTIEALLARVTPVDAGLALAPARVAEGMAALARAQPVFRRTGGLHAAVVLDAGGALLAAAEDVGRHNAVDKVVGALLRTGRAGPEVLTGRAGPQAGAAGRAALLCVSGRAGFEVVQKAAAAGIPVVASVSAPSSLAVDLAERAGIALLGFVREGRMNAYAHGWRLGLAPPPGPRGGGNGTREHLGTAQAGAAPGRPG